VPSIRSRSHRNAEEIGYAILILLSSVYLGLRLARSLTDVHATVVASCLVATIIGSYLLQRYISAQFVRDLWATMKIYGLFIAVGIVLTLIAAVVVLAKLVGDHL
ncbi:MAG: hypothetical protein ACRD1H_02010, partial [Vicinamibacterales bacterium]